MKFIYHDGGRLDAGYKGEARDCVVRSIAIATEKPYQEVYNTINQIASCERKTKRKGMSSARTGVYKATQHKYLASLGWTWTPTMLIGSGCKVHLCEEELPMGRLIVALSKHLTTVVDGVIYDTFDPQRYKLVSDGCIPSRCVYGYWSLT